MPNASDRLALRSCRLFETGDPEDARARISRVMQPHDLRLCGAPGEAGRRRSHMDFLRLDGVGVGTIAFGPAEIEVPPLDGYNLIIFCLAGGARLRTDGEEIEIDRFHGIVCAPGRPLRGRFSADCEQFVMRIERRRMMAFHGRPDTGLPARLDLRSSALSPWLAALRRLVTDRASVDLIRRHADVAADYEQLLLRLLLNGQQQTRAVPRGAVRSASVVRAIGYMEAHFALAITLGDIARAARVPERTLHEAFRRFEGMSPMRYLRNFRLDRARDCLALNGGDGTVTSAALGAGFTHLGRFSQEYAERFGECPSRTRARGLRGGR